MAFKDRLRSLRDSVEMTQKELATELKVDYANYNKWENGTIPSLETICAIADYFNVTTDYLLERTENKRIENIMIGQKLRLTDSTIRAIEHMGEPGLDGHMVFNYLFDHGLEVVITDLSRLIQQYCAAKITEEDYYSTNAIQKELNAFLTTDIHPASDVHGNPVPGLFSMLMDTDDFLSLKLQQIGGYLRQIVKEIAKSELDRKVAINNGNYEIKDP